MQDSRYVQSLMEVARAVPVNYKTLLIKRKEPTFPPDHNLSGRQRYDVVAIREWLRINRTAHNAPDYGYKFSPDPRQQAYADRAKAAAQRERFKLEVEMGEYIERSSVLSQLQAGCHVVRRELTKALEHELPPRVANMEAHEIRKIMAAKLREIFTHLPQNIMGGSNGNGQGSR